MLGRPGSANPGTLKDGIFGSGGIGKPGIGGGNGMLGNPGSAGSGNLQRDIHATKTPRTGVSETKPAPAVPVIGAAARGLLAPTPSATEPPAIVHVGADAVNSPGFSERYSEEPAKHTMKPSGPSSM